MEKLDKLLMSTPAMEIANNDSLVIFSDLHIGNGGKMDDFLHNGHFFQYIIENYYEKKDFKLILNGDIDELHRFTIKAVTSHWRGIYKIFQRFHDRKALFKLWGNHDYELTMRKRLPHDIPVREALKLRYNDNDLFIFHGHQAGRRFNKVIHWFIGIILRFVANLFRIRNYSVAVNKIKKYKVENRIYDFARKNKIMALIGHTHRPLFESMSKKETLKFKIEALCREYPSADPETKIKLEHKIKKYKDELVGIIRRREEEGLISNLYNSGSEPLVPCMFNSGCAIGNSGITCLEISHGNIRLVYWFDNNVSNKYTELSEYEPRKLDESPYYRVVLKEDSLDYMFTRIKLLSD